MNAFVEKLKAGKPDGYLPLVPFIHVNFVNAFYGAAEANCDIDPVQATPEVYRRFGFDMIHRNCTPAYDPIVGEAHGWTVDKTERGEAGTQIVSWRIDTPGGELDQEWRTTRISTHDVESTPVRYLIKTPQDFDLCRRFQPDPPAFDTSSVRRALEAVDGRGIVAPWVQGAFNFAAVYYCKLDDLLTFAMTDECFYREMMECLLARNTACIDRILSEGPDAVSYGGNVASGGIIGRRFFERYVAEYERRLIDHIQSRGVAVLYHNCGRAAELYPAYAELGLAAYESLTPPPHGDTDLTYALETLPEEMVLVGNIDQIDLLMTGSSSEIRRAVTDLVDTVRASGRADSFVLATTDYLHEDTPHGNLLTLSQAARELNGL